MATAMSVLSPRRRDRVSLHSAFRTNIPPISKTNGLADLEDERTGVVAGSFRSMRWVEGAARSDAVHSLRSSDRLQARKIG
jgi:hypothetical protein